VHVYALTIIVCVYALTTSCVCIYQRAGIAHQYPKP
jgi:hypothetical protein